MQATPDEEQKGQSWGINADDNGERKVDEDDTAVHVLEKLHIFLVELLNPVPILLNLIYQGYPITIIRDIEKLQSTGEKNRKLLELIRQRGNVAYEDFKHCLRKGQYGILEVLELTEKGEDTSHLQHRFREEDALYKNLKDELVTYYRENESMIPAAPLVNEHKVPIEELYVLPPMWAYDMPLNFSLGKNTQAPEQMSDAQEKRETTVSQLFLSDKNVRYRKIYITAKAGCGKTSLSQKLTMTWCQAHLPLMSLTENYNDEELAAMKYFDFLFLLHLRDYQSEPPCNLDDLIMQMLSNNLSRNTLYTKEFLQRLLQEKPCLILLDGLDEWVHPDKCRRTPAVPHNNYPDSCTVLTTSTTWKLGNIGLAEHNIDRHIEISALNDEERHQLEENAIRILNEKHLNLARKTIADFDKEVKTVQFGDSIYNPYILLQLMCLFFSGLPIGKSKCEIYSNITEFTLQRGLLKKNLPNIYKQSNYSVHVPNCMKENNACKCYFILLRRLGMLAFNTLFCEKRESSLIFDRRIVAQIMTEQEIEFCLKVGLLCQTKVNSIIAVQRYHVFFQDKSVQEFFSAIYITSIWQNISLKSTILNVCSSLSGILEMTNLFVFVCGMNPEVYTCISGELQKIVDLGDVTSRYRTDMFNRDNEETRNIIKSYQSMQVQCFQESVRNGNDSCQIHLHDILLNDDILRDDDSTALKMIITSNKGNVQSLKLSLGYQKTEDFVTSLEPGVFTSLETLTVECRNNFPVWLADILTESSCTLKCLTLSLGRFSLSDISITALTFLTYVQSLRLDHVKMTHRNLKCLYVYCSHTTKLTQLKLADIDCSDHEHQYRDCDITSDLHRLNELKILELVEVSCSDLHVNPASLKNLLFRPQGKKTTSSASATLWQDLRAAPVLSSLELGRLVSCQEMIQTIPLLIQLQFLKLDDIDMGDLIPRFSTEMTMLERVELHMVMMTPEAWRVLFVSVGHLPRIKTVKLSEIKMTVREWKELLLRVCSLPHPINVELNMCRGPSDKEWNTIDDLIKQTRATSLTLLRTGDNIPKEILKMDATAIKQYKKVLAEEEEVYNIRAKTVGHFGGGTKVLETILIDQDQQIDISTRIPTKGIDLHVGKMTVNPNDGIWKQQTSDQLWIKCLALDNVAFGYKAIRKKQLPSQEMLDDLVAHFGKQSSLVFKLCDCICLQIKRGSEHIVDVWPATKNNETKITFVIIVKEPEKGDKEVRLVKLTDYAFVKRKLHNVSDEGRKVIYSEEFDQSLAQMTSMETERIRRCINLINTDLMKKHRYLTMISSSPVRSRGYDSQSHILEIEPCIVLHVLVKGYIPIQEDPFESSYFDIPVDVREGFVTLFTEFADSYHTSLKNGCQIARSRCGTLGGFIDHPGFGICGLTCAHVLLKSEEMKELHTKGEINWNPNYEQCVYQPNNDDSEQIRNGRDYRAGKLVKAIYREGGNGTSGIEIAIFQVENRSPVSGCLPSPKDGCPSNMCFDSGKTMGNSRLGLGFNDVTKFGASTDITDGTVLMDAPDMSVKLISHDVEIVTGFNITLHNLLAIKSTSISPTGESLPFALPGDSGALVFRKDKDGKLFCVGVVEGGTSDGTCIVMPILPVLGELKLTCLKDFETDKKLNHIEEQLTSFRNHVTERLDGMDQNIQQAVQNAAGNIQHNLADEMRRQLAGFHQLLDAHFQNINLRLQNQGTPENQNNNNQ